MQNRSLNGFMHNHNKRMLLDTNSVPKKAFTLIEVVIAIMIFGVGVLVSLHAVTYFIGIGDQVQKRAQATLLAKEALDIIYNQRDSNIRKWVVWNCYDVNIDKEQGCEARFKKGESYIIWFDGEHNYKVERMQWDITSEDAKLASASLWAGPTRFYTHKKFKSGAEDSPRFSRIVTFSEAMLDEKTTLDQWKVLKVTIKVSYLPDNKDRVVLLESFIAAWEKTE